MCVGPTRFLTLPPSNVRFAKVRSTAGSTGPAASCKVCSVQKIHVSKLSAQNVCVSGKGGVCGRWVWAVVWRAEGG